MHPDHHGCHQIPGIEETMHNLRVKHHLQWIDHLAHIKDSQMSKQLLFGELEKKEAKSWYQKEIERYNCNRHQSSEIG